MFQGKVNGPWNLGPLEIAHCEIVENVALRIVAETSRPTSHVPGGPPL